MPLEIASDQPADLKLRDRIPSVDLKDRVTCLHAAPPPNVRLFAAS